MFFIGLFLLHFKKKKMKRAPCKPTLHLAATARANPGRVNLIDICLCSRREVKLKQIAE